MAAKGVPKKKCFVVGPIGDDDSEDRIHADWLSEDIIRPLFDSEYPDWEVTRADKISTPGSINEQIISALLNDDLVIADLTSLNANAFYEIGIRHVVQKPIIHMHLQGQRIPFDVASFRSIPFSRTRPRDIKAARMALGDFLKTVLAEGYQVNNPVTFSRGKVAFEETATAPEKVLSDQMEALSRRLIDLEVLAYDNLDLARPVSNSRDFLGRPLEEAPRLNVVIMAPPEGGRQQVRDFLTNFGSILRHSAESVTETDAGMIFGAKNTPRIRDEIKRMMIAATENPGYGVKVDFHQAD